MTNESDDRITSIARALWSVYREVDDRVDMELEDMPDVHFVWEMARAAIKADDADRAQSAQAEPSIEDLCARIKAADDAAADNDYMLDSDDCIKVLRGEWKAPLAMDKPTLPTPKAEPEPVEALRPFAEIGAWLFARNLPDDTPLVEVSGLNGVAAPLTRGHFKAAHIAMLAATKAQPPVEPVAAYCWLPVDGDTRGYEGDIVLRHKSCQQYRVGHTSWIGSNESIPYSSGGNAKPRPAFKGTREMGLEHWMPLGEFHSAPALNALYAETAIKNCLEAGETMRVLKRVVNLLLESRRNLGPEDHELRDRIDQLFRPDAAIAAQSARSAQGDGPCQTSGS